MQKISGDVLSSNSVKSSSVDAGLKFTDFGFDVRILKSLESMGYVEPSPIQKATIPVLLEGRDVVGLAQTGTGKTAAFALPGLSLLLDSNMSSGVQILVLAPTRELALQVAEAFNSYAEGLSNVKVLSIYGGQSYGPQLQGLRRGAQIVVGTPGRVIDHLERGSLDLSNLRYLVLDEADEMLRMGFQQDVEQILAKTSPKKQVALFSATMPSAIRRIAGKYLNNPVEVKVDSVNTTGANISQSFVQVAHNYKFDVLLRLLEVGSYGGVICFVRTKQATVDLADRLMSSGCRAAAINGDIAQQQRESTIDQLRSGEIDVLVATDVAARGLDVERIGLVVNYDVPHDTESYVHRIGRTGRAGRAGRAVLFVTAREKRFVRILEKATNQSLESIQVPSASDVNQARLERLANRTLEVLSNEDLSVFRDFVVSFEKKRDVNVADAAMALAFLAQGGRALLTSEIPEPSAFGGSGGGASSSRQQRGGRKASDANKSTYRISVGKSHRVQPGAIVGAIANEGGVSSSDIGQIDIRSDYSLVDLPKDLSDGSWRALRKTRIGGRLINLELDKGPRLDKDSGKGRRSGSAGGGRKGGSASQGGGFESAGSSSVKSGGDFRGRGGRASGGKRVSRGEFSAR